MASLNFNTRLSLECNMVNAVHKVPHAIAARHRVDIANGPSGSNHLANIACELAALAVKRLVDRKDDAKKKSDALLGVAADLIKKADMLDQDIQKMQNDLSAAMNLDKKLGEVPANRRFEIHNKCSDLFNGEGSPRKVISALRRKLEGAERSKVKVTSKIQEEARKQLITIKRVFIDGNNLCSRPTHNGSIFLGTSAIEALATALINQGYVLTIVFDQKIGTSNNRISFQRILQNFEDPIEVLQAPPQTPADELLMSFATAPDDCILSNDRFDDYSHKDIVKEGRVFRVLINENTIAVPFLNMDVSYSAPPKKS